MLNLIRYYIWMYLDIVSRTPDMDDGDGFGDDSDSEEDPKNPKTPPNPKNKKNRKPESGEDPPEGWNGRFGFPK